MKHPGFLIILVIIAAGSSATIQQLLHKNPANVSPGAEPGLSIRTEPESVDLGEMMQGQTKKDHVTITNTTTQVLRVERISSTCDCSTGTPDKKVLPPGATLTIQVAFNSSTRTGLQKHMVTVWMNGGQPDSRSKLFEVKIPITAFVRAYVTAEITEINFGNVEIGKKHTRAFHFHYATDSPPHTQPILLNPTPEYHITSNYDASTGMCRMTVEFTPQSKSGLRLDRLRFDTGIAGYPINVIEVSADVAGSFQIEPRVIHWGTVRKDRLTKKVSIQSKAIQDTESIDIKIHKAPAHYQTSIIRTPNGHELTVEIQAAKLRKSTILNDTIILETNDPTERYIALSLDGIISEPLTQAKP